MKYLLFTLLLLPSFYASAADSTYSGDSIQKLYLEIRYLHRTGVGIHQKYDPSDLVQLKACTSEHGYIGTRARSVVGIANRLNHQAKEDFIKVAWQAYSCIKCSSPMSSCEPIPAELKKIKAIMAKEYQERNQNHE